MSHRILRITLRFAIAIAVILALAGLFTLYTRSQLSQARQDEVLIKAIPFVAIFVSIVLAFILVIVLVAVALGGKVPLRSYTPIELLIIAGILLGVVGLFQGWKMFSYEYGFLLLLAAVLLFMVWSHLSPMSARQGKNLPPLSRQAHVIAVIAGLVVWALVAGTAIRDSKPAAPYGISQTLWEYKNDEERAQIKNDAESEYRNAQVPVFLLMSLLPGTLVYFAVREIVPTGRPVPPQAAAPLREEGVSPG